ncbi:MAG: endonuclease/exonuclease/phosphatase family protein [Hyphomonadaceae bacterium]|nr:MAG: hypothetical protein FD160_565 [Caulobacteraceae bacterium]MBT9445645.1 endonuclease/exonuclease/phosphatase family protein [Hyphomonadaceae bacterium]TPW05532.1 MAG: hypothetical protein FD124_2119 [Alphaproteobacteria bacterium]
MIRVVTLNFWKDEGDLGARLPLIASGLVGLAADIVCLQEVYADADMCVGRYLARELGLSLAAHPARAKVRNGQASTSGLAILTSWRIMAAEAHELPMHEADGQRLAQLVEVLSPQGRLGVLNLHLSHLRDDVGVAARARQLDAAAAWAQRDGRRPLVIAGDFNAGVDAPEVKQFVRRYDADFGTDASALASSTLRCRANAAVDHVALVGGGSRWHVCARDTVLTEVDPVNGVWPSDHFGVLATLASQP